MVDGQSNNFSEKQLSFYLDEYYERADLIFRFGALLTLSREGAERLVDETFKALIENFASIKESANPRQVLMAHAWKAWEKMSSERFQEWNVPILKGLKTLGVNQRAVLFAIELAGLDHREAAVVFGLDENAFRADLASANRFLAVNTIGLN